MTVDLSLYLNKNVEVTYRSGRTEIGVIKRNDTGAYEDSHPYKFGEDGRTFTKGGKYISDEEEGDSDIVKVRLIGATRYAHLEERVAELQAEIERLKAEEEAEKPKLPEIFYRQRALTLLDGEHTYGKVMRAFTWKNTPQGHDYWYRIAHNCKSGIKIPDEALSYLKDMVILSYRQEHGD